MGCKSSLISPCDLLNFVLMEDLPEGINLGDASISEEEKSQLSQFLGNWKHIFSTSFTDLGNFGLVKHKINLTIDQPIKEPPRRIAPALYTEVKEHLVEMIEAGAVRPSYSPYSSNIVLARKKDGSTFQEHLEAVFSRLKTRSNPYAVLLRDYINNSFYSLLNNILCPMQKFKCFSFYTPFQVVSCFFTPNAQLRLGPRLRLHPNWLSFCIHLLELGD